MAIKMKHIEAIVKVQRASGFSLDLDIKIQHGDITALYGPSGSGKSSVLRMIAGLEPKMPGVKVKTDAETWADSHVFVPTHKRGIGFVFQQTQLFPHLNVLGNLQYALQRKHQQSDIELAQVKQWLGIDAIINKPIDELSGGELQRVSIARVLLNSPRALLMDEPLGALDQRARMRILPYIDHLHDRLDFPFLYVSHAIDEVTYLADQIYLLENGRIHQSGTTFEISNSLEMNAREGDAAAATIRCSMGSFDEQFNLTKLNFEGQSIYVTGDRRVVREPDQNILKLRIPARDVSLTLGRNANTSILNILQGTIDQIHQNSDGTSALVRIKVGEQFILSRITGKSLTNLQINTGSDVFIQIKSVGLLTEYDD